MLNARSWIFRTLPLPEDPNDMFARFFKARALWSKEAYGEVGQNRMDGFTIIVRRCFLMFFSGFIVMFDCEIL